MSRPSTSSKICDALRSAMCASSSALTACPSRLPPPELATCVDLDSDGKIVKIRLRRADALGKLVQHLDLLRPDVSPARSVTIGADTNINVTEVILEQLSTEELRVVEKMLLLKAAASPIPLSNATDGSPQ
jgi:hypothetical protein